MISFNSPHKSPTTPPISFLVSPTEAPTTLVLSSMNVAPQIEENELSSASSASGTSSFGGSSFEFIANETFIGITDVPSYLVEPRRERRPAWKKSSSFRKDQPQRRKEVKLTSANTEEGPPPSKISNQKAGPSKDKKANKPNGKEKTRRRKKKLRFGMSEHGRVLCEYIGTELVMTEEEMELYWYSEEMMDRFLEEAQADSEDVIHTSCHHHMELLLEGCRGSCFKDTFHSSHLVASAFKVAKSIFRGLEVAVYNDHIHQEQDSVVTSVLDEQYRAAVRGKSIRETAKKVASASKKRSKYSKRFAFAIAFGDALVAYAIHRPEER